MSTICNVQLKFSKLVVCNPCQSFPSLTILVHLWFIIISLVFFFLSKLLFYKFSFNFKAILHMAKRTQRWLEAVSSIVKDIDFDGSL